MNLKLDYKKTFLIGFGFFGISVMWTLYNSYVPIYLQAGSPTFDAPGEVGFGLGAGLGVYTGLYYIASQLASVAGPTINGYIVEWGGGDYNLIFVATPVFYALAILCMLGVTRGEAKVAVGE